MTFRHEFGHISQRETSGKPRCLRDKPSWFIFGSIFGVQSYMRIAPTVGDIIGAFKSLCVQDQLKYIKQNNVNVVGSFWQRNYYEHIIRNEDKLNKIREYIITNPLKWSLDRENPDRQGSDQLEDEIFNIES